jgi:hypothetical protein
MRHIQKRCDIRAQRRGVKALLKFSDNLGKRVCAVAALENFAGGWIQLHHALRV